MQSKNTATIAAVVTAAAAAVTGIGYAVFKLVTRPRPHSRIRYTNEVAASPEEVLDLFSDPKRLASMMKFAEVDEESGRLTWHQFGPLGFVQTWAPEVDRDRQTGMVRWRSDDEAAVEAQGRIKVRRTDYGTTRVEFTTDFVPPTPIWPAFLDERTRQRIESDLDRVCEHIEAVN